MAFVGCVSRDRFGRLLRSHLLESGVSLDHLVSVDEPTTLAIVPSTSGRPEYSFYSQGTSAPRLLEEELPDLVPGAALHLGSISLVMQPGATTLTTLMRRESRRRLISLDPNIRPTLIPDDQDYRRSLGAWLGLVDVVKVSDEDLAWLEPDRDPRAVITRWLTRGVVLAVVTMGVRAPSQPRRRVSPGSPAPSSTSRTPSAPGTPSPRPFSRTSTRTPASRGTRSHGSVPTTSR